MNPVRGLSELDGLSETVRCTVRQTFPKNWCTLRRIKSKTRTNSRWTRRTGAATDCLCHCDGRSIRLAELEPERGHKGQTSLSFHGSETAEWIELRFQGKGEASLGDATPKILEHQTNQNVGNRQTTELKPLPKVPTEIHELKERSSVWGVKIIHKEAQGTHPCSPWKNPNRNALKSRIKWCTKSQK
jgi:hypothetical protein